MVDDTVPFIGNDGRASGLMEAIFIYPPYLY